ncbi:MAG: hypothetical protein AAF563_12300 [Pseudomonadota bacterium]
MKVLVTVPTTGWIHKHSAFALLKLQLDRRFKLRILLPTHRPFENNLHHIVNDFMAGGEDYWLSFDADNPPLENPLDLVLYDKDVIGCPTPIWHYAGKPNERPFLWNVFKKVAGGYTEWPVHDGLQRVDAIGTGCFLVARRVFEDSEMRKAPFQRITNADGTVERGNDMAFCERATARGHEIWAHFDYQCMHFNKLELGEVIRAFQGMS